MTNSLLLVLSATTLAISISFAITMIYSDGYAYMNAYNEGWVEVVFLGVIGILGIWRGLK